MSQPQSAIVPEAGPFALYAMFNVVNNHQKVLQTLQSIPTLVDEINQQQPGAQLVVSVSFSRQFWQHLDAPMPDELIDFPELGKGKVIAPSTAMDFLIHAHAQRHDLLFYLLRKCMESMAEHITVVDEVYGFRYLDSRDMTGFIDGTENPEGNERHKVAVIADGPLAGGSYVMLQRYEHELPAWSRLNISAQEKVIGRTKADSVELDNVPAASHVGRVDIKENGQGLKIVRHSLPYGTATGVHGLLFVAYCHTLHNFQVLLESMYGHSDNKTDQLLRFTNAKTGAYLFAPSLQTLQQLVVKSAQ
ncbi:Dyp-type peroxidase [Vibrio zhugei]|uniref:Dyp-type peroxidase n=1 Tax=Vibrio zhugei TaxID=2479546 RepID=A0ABV7C8N7_9VIBR|nr:Dyp-type peroxidase [Vibrio zhugei]